MAANPCVVCGGSKNSGIHSRFHPEYHAHMDARGAAKLAQQSKGRTDYMASQQHKDAYADRGSACLMGLAGAPTPCSGGPTPHHILARSAAGGLERAEQYPVITLCSGHNTAVEQDPTVRKWAETHYFERGGIEYPFRLRLKPASAATSGGE